VRWKPSSGNTCTILFPGMKLEQATIFRVTRDSEYEIGDDESKT